MFIHHAPAIPGHLQEPDSEPQSDSESNSDEEALLDSAPMVQHAYFCFECAQRAPGAGGQARGVQLFHSIRAVQGHINRTANCRRGNYSEVQRAVRCTDVAAGGVGKARDRTQSPDEGFCHASHMEQAGIMS